MLNKEYRGAKLQFKVIILLKSALYFRIFEPSMRKLRIRDFIGIGLLFLSLQVKAQQVPGNNAYRDSVVQLYGVIMTADSLKAIPYASVTVNHKGRGTITNNDGVFSLAVIKGESITFSCVGFKNRVISIPKNLEGNDYSVIQLMVNDTNFLPATILKPRPTKAQFERDFVNSKIDDDLYETARKNTSPAQKKVILSSLPYDGKEAVGASLNQQAAKYYYSGQLPPMNILNPAAWKSFINSWKKGEFKSKN